MTGHATCAHRTYRMSCDEADALILEAGGHCQRCGSLTDHFHHDHDHALGEWAVRGLICRPCNWRLGQVDAGRVEPDQLDLAYLAAPWHLTHRPTPPPPRKPQRRGDGPPMRLRHVRLPRPMLDEVKREADRDGIGDAEVVRRALRYYFERDAARAPDTTRSEEI